MKTTIISLLALSSLAISNAAVITGTNLFNSDATDTIILFNSAPASSGVAVGGWFASTFNVSAAVSAAISTNDFSTLTSNFNQIAIGVLGDDLLGTGTGGLYFFSDDFNIANKPSAPLNAILYTFLGNGNSLATSSHFALLRSVEIVEADGGQPDDNQLNPQNSTLLIGNFVAGGTQTTPGDPSSVFSYDFGSGAVEANTLALVGIPEPSAALLSAIGALAFLRRRR